jgi:hypothetical protein
MLGGFSLESLTVPELALTLTHARGYTGTSFEDGSQ